MRYDSPPGFAGRVLALTGIVLIALNLRTSIASISPILAAISVDVPIDLGTVALLGVLPPAAFAVFGLLGSMLALRVSLETSILLALGVSSVGHTLRAFATTNSLLVVATLLSLAGMGAANVLLPPLVKRYFPGREGVVTSLYAALIGVSTALPAFIAVPVTNTVGWRSSLGVWALLALVAIIPWVRLAWLDRHGKPPEFRRSDGIPVASRWAVQRSPQAWAVGILFSVSAMNGYAMFAWLPTILTDVSGASDIESGFLLSLYAALGIPLAVVIPSIVQRSGRPATVVAVGLAATVVGNLGLLLVPHLPWLWVAIAGLGPLLFPACLTLFALRARTNAGSVAFSGFSQGVGYLLGSLGPLVVGALYGATQSWSLPLVFLSAVAVPGIWAARVVARSGAIEDELRARSKR